MHTYVKTNVTSGIIVGYEFAYNCCTDETISVRAEL